VVAKVRAPDRTSALSRVSRLTVPRSPGLYAIYEQRVLIYVGESGCLCARFGDLFRTQHHSFRRKLGKKLYALEPGFVVATSKRPFPADIEKRLTEYMERALTYVTVPIPPGRAEIEARLVSSCPGLLNSRGQRGT
jgi:hypothetical protein